MFVFCNIDDTRGEPVLTVSVKHITCNVPEVVQSFSLKMGEMDDAALTAFFKKHGVRHVSCSSSVDFAEEYDVDPSIDVRAFIESALSWV